MNIRPFVFVAVSCLLVALGQTQTQSQESKPRRIMCIGASITMGQGVNGGYRLPLEKMFEGAGIPVQFVGRIDWNSKGMTSPYHDGYPGHRIDQIENGATNTFKITSLPIADGVKETKPDTVLLLCGTNDVRQNYNLAEAPQRLDHLVETIHAAAPDAQIYLGTLPADLHYDDAVRRYNAALIQVVAKRAAAGEKVYLVDHYPTLLPGTDFQPDHTHPSAAGYTKIARNWFNALVPHAPQIAFVLTNEGANQFTGKSCLGYQITMKRKATLTDLGIYCAGQPLTEAHAVGVFDDAGKVLAQTNITPDDKPSGLFAYEKLATSLDLQEGKTYFIVSNSVGLPTLAGTDAVIDPLFFDNPRFYFDHNVAVTMDDKNGTTLKFPGAQIKDINGGLSYFGPIFRMAPQ